MPVEEKPKEKKTKKSKSSKRTVDKKKTDKSKKSKKKDSTPPPVDQEAGEAPKAEVPTDDSPAAEPTDSTPEAVASKDDTVNDPSPSVEAEITQEDSVKTEEPANESPTNDSTDFNSEEAADLDEPVIEPPANNSAQNAEEAGLRGEEKTTNAAIPEENTSDVSPATEGSTEIAPTEVTVTTEAPSTGQDNGSTEAGDSKPSEAESTKQIKVENSAGPEAKAPKDNADLESSNNGSQPSAIEESEEKPQKDSTEGEGDANDAQPIDVSDVQEVKVDESENPSNGHGEEGNPDETQVADSANTEALNVDDPEKPMDGHEPETNTDDAQAADTGNTKEGNVGQFEKANDDGEREANSRDHQAHDAATTDEDKVDGSVGADAEPPSGKPEAEAGGEGSANAAVLTQETPQTADKTEAVTIEQGPEASPSEHIELVLEASEENKKITIDIVEEGESNKPATNGEDVPMESEAGQNTGLDHKSSDVPIESKGEDNSVKPGPITQSETAEEGHSSQVPTDSPPELRVEDGIGLAREGTTIELEPNEQAEAGEDGGEMEIPGGDSEPKLEGVVSDLPVESAHRGTEGTIPEEAPPDVNPPLEAAPSPTSPKHRRHRGGWEREPRHKKGSSKGSVEGSSSRNRRSSGSTSKSAEVDALLQAAKERKVNRRRRSSFHRESKKDGEGGPKFSERPRSERHSSERKEEKKPEKRSSAFRPKLLNLFPAESDTGVVLRANGQKARTRPHAGPRHATDHRPSHHRSRSDRPSSSWQPSREEEEARRERHRQRRREAEEAEEAARRELKKKRRELEEAQREALKARERKKERERRYRYEKGKESKEGGVKLREGFAKGLRMIFT